MQTPETWTDFCQLRWTGREKVSSRMGKIRFERFLAEHRFPRSRILREFANPNNIELLNLPNFFVLKPADLWSARGVMLLRTIEDGLYFDDMSKKKLNLSDIISSLQTIRIDAKKSSLKVIAEERPIDEDDQVIIPFDYKLFTFFGQVKFILQVDRNHNKPKLAFFDSDFNPISDERVVLPKGKENSAGVHRKPKCHAELVALASELSLRLNAPFISIDCYATKSGALFGELTHTPGGPWLGSMYRFSDSFDKELGQAWHDALNRLDQGTELVESTYEIKHKGKVVRSVIR